MSGVSLSCERNTQENYSWETCLNCGEGFWLNAAMLVARGAGEWLGYLCPAPTCLDERGRERFAEACKRFRAEGRPL